MGFWLDGMKVPCMRAFSLNIVIFHTFSYGKEEVVVEEEEQGADEESRDASVNSEVPSCRLLTKGHFKGRVEVKPLCSCLQETTAKRPGHSCQV
jgi:hypothetical protein